MKLEIEINGELYVSTQIIKARFGIGSMTANRWIHSGQLPEPLRIGKRNFFNAKQVEERMMNSKWTGEK